MKKSKLLLVLSCVGLLGVTACNNQAPTSSSNPPEPPVSNVEDITFSDDKLLNDVLLKNNSEEKDVVENPKVRNVTLTPTKESFKKENIIRNDANHGLLVVKNDEGYVGFYSLLHHNWLIKPSFEEGKFGYRIFDLNYINYLLEIHYRDTYVVLDAFGNIIENNNLPISSDEAEYYYDDTTESDYKHRDLVEDEKRNYYLSVNIINEKPVLLVPFLETEEHEELAEDQNGLIPKKDEEGEVVRDEDGHIVYETKIVKHEFVTAYFYEYSSNGNCKVLKDEYGNGYAHGWPEEIEEEEELPEEIKELQIGDYYIGGVVDLAKKGLPGYYLAKSGNANNIYTVYNENGEVKTSFAIQSKLSNHPMIQEVGIIGTRMVFQVAEQVADDSENYDVFIRDVNPSYLNPHSGAKYIYESFTIDLLTGQKREFETDYLFKDITPIKGVNGEYLYAVTFSTIDENKTLNEARTYIVDKNLSAHDDITGFDFGKGDKTDPFTLKELQDGKYFDAANMIVYSNTLKPIVHLKGITELQYLPEHNVFIGKYNGKWGLVATDGKVAAEFAYNSIDYERGISGRFLAKKGDNYYLVGDGKNEVLVGWDVEDLTGVSLNYLPVGNNGLYAIIRTNDSQNNSYQYQFFDAQSTVNGVYTPFASARPGNTYSEDITTYDVVNKEYKTKSVDVIENEDDVYLNDNLLGQYTLLFVSNGENNYTVEKVAVLDQYDDPVKDIYGKLAYDEEIKNGWEYTYTAIAPSNLNLKSYDSGEECLEAYYAAKDEETAQVLSLDDNEVLVRTSGSTYLVFTPDKDNQPYVFTANPEVTLGSTATERWEETPEVIRLFAQYGDDTTLRIASQTNTLVLTLELEESEPNPTADPAQDPAADPAQDPAADPAQDPAADPAQDPAAPAYKPGKIDLKDLILHKVYNDKNEAQKRNVNSHMAISLEDVTIYELVKIEEPAADPAQDPADPAADPAQDPAAPEEQEEPAWSFPVSPKEGYEWVKFEGTEVEITDIGEDNSRNFMFVLNGTEPEKEEDLSKAKLFYLSVKGEAASDAEAEELNPWDPTKEFNMVTSEDQMAKNQKSESHQISVKKTEEDVTFYFGESYVGEDEHAGEWADGILNAGHDYYFTLTSKQQVNNVEVKESHIHKVTKWLMADIVALAASEQTLTSGYKLGVCEVGEEAMYKESTILRSDDELTKEEVDEFLANLEKDTREFGVLGHMSITSTADPQDPYGPGKQTSATYLNVLEGIFPADEIAKYNENRKKEQPEMVEIKADKMTEKVTDIRATKESLKQFLNKYVEEEDKVVTPWDVVEIRYLYDPELVQVIEEEGKDPVVKQTKSYYSIYATSSTNNSRFVGIYNSEGVILWSSLEVGLHPTTYQTTDKTTLVLNGLYTVELAELFFELQGL